MTVNSKQFQWAQLSVLSAAHFLVDLFAGMIPSILPEIRSNFKLDISQSTLLMGTLFVTCNGVQLITGHMRSDKHRPFWLYVGPVLVACMCFFNAVPVTSSSLMILLSLTVVSGVGIGTIHPEGLRGIHTLDHISPATTTVFFMSTGIAGFALGGYIAPVVIESYGLASLYFFTIPLTILLVAIILLRIKLAVEPKAQDEIVEDKNAVHFLPLLLAAIPACTATTLLVGMLPTRLEEFGFTLSFGGFSIMLLNIGGAIGGFFWAAIANRKSDMFASNLAFFLAVPIFAAYLILIENQTAVYLLFAGGFCGLGGFPLLVTAARRAVGASLGLRMGFIVGGSWGIAAVIMILLGPLAEAKGVHLVLKIAVAFYLLSTIIGLYIVTSKRLKN